ncbi:hypothetical protein SLOPH_614, partial [Spraguea lophii 42_110]
IDLFILNNNTRKQGMVNFLNLFMTFIILNYDGFLQNINATNNNINTEERKKVIRIENIKKEKYEINGIMSISSPNCTEQRKQVKITEIEYDGVELEFRDNEQTALIYVEEPDFYRIMNGDLTSNVSDIRLKILSVVFKVTAFIEEKCFHTTLWYNCFSNSIKISTLLQDQPSKTIRLLGLNFCSKYLILPLDCFDNTTNSNSECSGDQDIYNVYPLKPGQGKYDLDNLTIDKDSKTYNIDAFIFNYIYSEVYTKFYYETHNRGMINGYIGKSANQCNMNKEILCLCKKTNKPRDENNKNIILNENSTQTDEIETPNPDLTNKYQCCQKRLEPRKHK